MSADVTLGVHGGDFAADNTQRTCTLRKPGGWLSNIGPASTGVAAYVNWEAATVTTTDPAGNSGKKIDVGCSIPIPDDVSSFTFKTASGSTNLSVSQ